MLFCTKESSSSHHSSLTVFIVEKQDIVKSSHAQGASLFAPFPGSPQKQRFCGVVSKGDRLPTKSGEGDFHSLFNKRFFVFSCCAAGLIEEREDPSACFCHLAKFF